jgi:F-type H+-transporting ATPase subunit b
MDETLRQLGELLLRSIPTVIFLLVVYVGYRFIVHRPLARVLQERYSRTEGAIEKARADIAAADAKTAEYEQRLRQAKVALFKAQEARRNQALQLRADILNSAREQASAKVREARAALERDIQSAKTVLEHESERLATEIISTLLKPISAAQTPAGGAH